MAAPVAAGMAALVRTRFDDKSVYSSRFIMGQVASTGASKQGLHLPRLFAESFLSADALRTDGVLSLACLILTLPFR